MFIPESYFVDLSRRCKDLHIHCLQYFDISSGVLLNVYKVDYELFKNNTIMCTAQSMNDGSATIHRLSINQTKKDTFNEFLNAIGITYRNEQVFSNKKIEVFICVFLYFVKLNVLLSGIQRELYF